MGRALSLIALLTLTSCIEVRDIGTFWEKGTTDPALSGRWRAERADGIRDKNPVETTVVIKGGEYIFSSDKKTDPPVLARTLKAGNYTFFMTDPGNRSETVLYRYTLRLNVLQLYNIKGENLRDWLQQHYPEHKGFHLSPTGFDVLDDAVVSILSQVPDDERYWTPADDGRQRYRKLP